MGATMTKTADKVTAGLVFLGMRSFDIVRIGNRVCATLDRLDEQIAGFRVLSETSVTLRTASYALHIDIESDRIVPTLDRPAAQYIKLTLVRADSLPDESPDESSEPENDLALSIMAHALQTLHATLAPDYVQWVDPMAVLSSADFRMATTLSEEDVGLASGPETVERSRRALAAQNQPRRDSLPDIDQTNDALLARLNEKGTKIGQSGADGALRAVFRESAEDASPSHEGLRTDPEKSAALRLSVWLFTISLGIFALPVAAALVVFNLLRGENLRLTSQTAALTGTFIALQATGSTAQAMIAVQSILG